MQLSSWLTKIFGKRWGYILVTIAVVGVVCGVIWKVGDRPQAVIEEIPIVRTAVIGSSESSLSYNYSGKVCGRYESQLAFQVNGKIVKRNVQLGSMVNAGDVLLEIDAKDVVQTVNSNSAQVYSAESQLQLAKSNLNRHRELLEGGAISHLQYDQYVTAYNVAVAGLRQAQAQYAQSANQLDYTLLKADKPGVVSNISAEIGQVVSAGQPIVTVVQDGEWEVEINVPENRIEEMRQAKDFQVAFWALPDLKVEGKVREIAPMTDPVMRTFKVRISLINPPQEIKLGMTATVSLASSQEKTVYIPTTAIYQTGNTPAVWVVKEDTVVLRPINTGKFGNDSVEVLKGLAQGDRIVTKGVHKLKEGQKVQVGGEAL